MEERRASEVDIEEQRRADLRDRLPDDRQRQRRRGHRPGGILSGSSAPAATARRSSRREAWLSTVTTRLAIDHMRSARMRRESYVGPWLPEPLLTEEGPGPAEHAEVADTVSQAFLVMLETLSPVERAVFLLREVFGYDYPQIAESVGKARGNCRQIARRARKHVEGSETRFEADRIHGEELLDRFLEASETGDVEALKQILADDAIVYSDGGGKVVAARHPFSGVGRIARFMVEDRRPAPPTRRLPPAADRRQRPTRPDDDRPRRRRHRRAHGRGRRRPDPDDPHRPQPREAPAPTGLKPGPVDPRPFDASRR